MGGGMDPDNSSFRPGTTDHKHRRHRLIIRRKEEEIDRVNELTDEVSYNIWAFGYMLLKNSFREQEERVKNEIRKREEQLLQMKRRLKDEEWENKRLRKQLFHQTRSDSEGRKTTCKDIAFNMHVKEKRNVVRRSNDQHLQLETGSDANKESETKLQAFEQELRQQNKLIATLKQENEQLKKLQSEFSLRIEESLRHQESQAREQKIQKSRLQEMEKDNEQLKSCIESMKIEKRQLIKERNDLGRANDDALKRIDELLAHQESQTQIQNIQAARLHQMEIETENLKSNIESIKTEKRQLIKERDEFGRAKDDALTRLSKAAGAKLTQGNPAITDLSDDNRPTKIAEKFSEIYDNLWTDAFEELADQGLDDLKIIDMLLQALKTSYEICTEKEQTYDSTITEAVYCIPEDHQGSTDRSNSPRTKIAANVQIQKAIVEIKLALGPTAGRKIAEVYMPHLEKSIQQSVQGFIFSEFPRTAEYVRQCTILCWLMKIRDPSVYIDFGFIKGGKFDGDLYRQYTKSGTKADYMVWPILYLHEGGPMLAKGVAQPL